MPEVASALFKERLNHLKFAQTYAAKGDIPKAVDRYKKYLYCLASYHGTTEEKLSPTLFDPAKDLTELFLISHCYWDLSKAYDRAPSLKKEAVRCLDQFVKFTIGFKYQHVNYRMMKKYMRKNIAHNPELFKEAYQRLKVETKGCYIASHAFGELSPEVVKLRQLKVPLLKSSLGNHFVDLYYSYSPDLISFLSRHPRLDCLFTHFTVKPFLRFIIRVLRL